MTEKMNEFKKTVYAGGIIEYAASHFTKKL